MHSEVLTKDQLALMPLVRVFSRDFVLAGGTAIALHIGHRRSIDFDLFSKNGFNSAQVRKKIFRYGHIEKTYVNEDGQYTVRVRGVKITFFHYPFTIPTARGGTRLATPNLLTLAAMKAFALGQRSKWKDYVDLHFILKDHYTLEEISKKAKKMFRNNFNERIFREALAYFRDVDYSEKVIFMPGFEVSESAIKKNLVKFSIS